MFLHKVDQQASNRLGYVTSQKGFISKCVLLFHNVADCLGYIASAIHDMSLTGQTKVQGEKPVTVPLCQPQI